MEVSDEKKIGFKEALLKYKSDLIKERKMEWEAKITHELSIISLVIGSCFLMVLLFFYVLVK